MIFELPSNYQFISFIKFNELDDLGYHTNHIKQSIYSTFAFITLNRKMNIMLVNVLLVDPYNDKIELLLQQSSCCFDTSTQTIND